MLTDDTICAFQTSAKPQRLSDEKGLYLLMTPGGARLWRFRYRFPPRSPGSKENLISLGRYPEVSLAQARERRDAARRDVAKGIDPSLRRTSEKFYRGNTLEAVAREFLGVLRRNSEAVRCGKPVSSDLSRARSTPHVCAVPRSERSAWCLVDRRKVFVR